MSYFKPKNAVYNGQPARRQEQPFYVSWFQQQGELKRGGTAPHESRKAMEQQRMGQQTIFKLNEPVQKPPQQRFKNSPYLAPAHKHNLQEISKIYAASGPNKAFGVKRRSQELQSGKGEQQKVYQQFTRSYQNTQQGFFQRTYTSSQQRAPKLADEKRPVSQQQSGGGVKQQAYVEDLYNERNVYQHYDAMESEPYEKNEGQKQCLRVDNLSEIIDSDEEEPVHHTNIDNMSNESQGAESKRNSLSPREKEEEQLANRSAFQQRDEEIQVVESLRKTTANMHRPMTSEGGRRRRNQQQTEAAQTEKTLDEKSKTTQNLAIDKNDLHTYDLPVTRVSPNNLSGCQIIQDFDEIEMFPVTPKEVDVPRSGFRRKPTDEVENYSTQRPPSRHKFPPKAVCLEVPNTGDMQDIPIKNMYANVGLDNSFEDMLKVNNKVNMSNFMRKGNEEESEKRPTFQSDQGEKTQIISKGASAQMRNHPQSANTKYKGAFNMSFSPMVPQVQPPHSSKAAHSNTENFEIVIKHNTSSQKTQQPVKVPFQTSLGQDFLRLFANHAN